MQCPFCNYEIKEQAQFCQKCGKKIPRCPTCGKAILKKSRFCPVDGTPLPDDLFSVCVENQKINNMPEMPIQKYDDEDMIYSDDKSQNPKRGIVFLLLGCVFLCAICIFVGYAVVTHNMNYESESIQAEMQNDAEQNIIDNQQQQPNDFSDITSQQQQELSQIATQAPSIVQNKNVPSVTMNMVTSAIGTSNFSETVDGQAITHYGDFVLDNDVSTAWIEGVDGYGLGESLTMQLQENCIVTGFNISGGFQKSALLYQKNSRPSSLQVTYSDGQYDIFTIDDIYGSQTVLLPQPKETNSICFTIKDVYHGSKYQDTAISEISLF